MTTDEILHTLQEMNARLRTLEQRSYGTPAVYVGNGRVLLRADSLNMPGHGPRLIYLVEGDDRVLSPRFIADGIFEPEVTSFFMKHVPIDANCLDVGANFGYYSCLFGRLSLRGKTIAIEANDKIYSLLLDNIHINWLSQQVKPINAAASDREGILTLYRRLTRASNTSIIHIPDEDLATIGELPSERFDVKTMPIDVTLEEFEGRVDFLKVDVEGAEPLVFRGAKNLIAANPQLTIVMEWSPAQMKSAGFDLSEFGAEISALGLEVYLISQSALQPISWDDLSAKQYLSGIVMSQRKIE